MSLTRILTTVITWVDVILATAKNTAKTLRGLGQLNKVFGSVLLKRLGPTFKFLGKAIMNSAATMGRLDVVNAVRFVDAMIWGATAVQIYLVIDSLTPAAKDFWVSVFKDEETTEAAVEFVIYVAEDNVGGIDLVLNQQFKTNLPDQFFDGVFIEKAYAASVKAKLGDLIRDALEETYEFANTAIKKSPEQAVGDAIVLYKSIRSSNGQLLAFTDKPVDVLKSTSTLTAVAGREAASGVLKPSTYNYSYGGRKDFHNRLSETEWGFMYKDGDFVPELKKGFNKWVNGFNSKGTGLAKHSHMGIMSIKYFASKNRVIKEIEAPRREIVNKDGVAVARRDHDVVTEEGGVLWYNELKSYDANTIDLRLDIYKSTKTDAITVPHSRQQLKTDLVEYVINGFQGNRWIFPKKAEVYEFAGVKGADAIIQKMLKIVKEEPGYFQKHLDIEVGTDWKKFLKDIEKNMKSVPFVELMDV